MASLTKEQKSAIVTGLATFCTPKEVQKSLKERFGIEASLQQIQYYDPGTVQGARELADEWKELFRATRERYIEGEAEVACAHRRYRLERIQRMLDDPALAKNHRMTIELLEAAAKERMATTPRRVELTGKDGGAIQTQAVPVDLTQLSDDDLAALSKLLDKASPDAGADSE